MEYIKDWAPPLAEIIKALFWPLIVGLFVVYFKEEIRDRLRKLKSLEAPGTKLGFDDALATQQKQIGVETEPALSLRACLKTHEYEAKRATMRRIIARYTMVSPV